MMSRFPVLLRRELGAYFLSPGTYVVIFLFLISTGALFMYSVNAINHRTFPLSLIEVFLQFTMLFGFVLVFPLLTMRLFAEEFKLGTIEPLMTAPVGDWTVVLSKYVASVIFYGLLWLPTVFYFTVFRWATGGNVASSSGVYWTAYLLVMLMGMAYLSIGLLASALTKNQVVAAIIAFAVISVVFYFGLLSGIASAQLPFFRDVISYFSAPEHMNDFFRGIIDTRAIVYYLSIVVLMLALTHRVVQSRRWRP
ncbi:MAG: ABC transporter permease subunit [Verrucomicrobiia bacterium]